MNNRKKADYVSCSRYGNLGYYDYYYDYYSAKRVRLHKIKVALKKLILGVVFVSFLSVMAYSNSANNDATSAQPVQNTVK